MLGGGRRVAMMRLTALEGLTMSYHPGISIPKFTVMGI